MRVANVPPPMSLRDVLLKSTPVDVATSPSGRLIAVLRDAAVDLIRWKFAKNKLVAGPELDSSVVELDAAKYFRQISFLDESNLGIVYDGEDGSVLETISVPDGGPVTTKSKLNFPRNGSFVVKLGAVPELGVFFCQDSERNVYLYNPETGLEARLVQLPAICPWIEVAVVGGQVITSFK
jgi:elongator complex protein 1